MKSSSASQITDRKLVAAATYLARKNLLSRTPDLSERFFIAIKKEIEETRKTYTDLIQDVNAARFVSREIEWLLDNFYVVETAIADVTASLESDDLRKLPSLLTKSSELTPHVYVVVSELLRVTDNVASALSIAPFLSRYQRDYPLSIRELNAIPFALKLVLISNIRDLIAKSLILVKEYTQAEQILLKIGATAKDTAAGVSYTQAIKMLTERYKTLSPNLGIYLIDQLSQYGSQARPIIRWLKLHLLRQGVSIGRLREIDNEQRDRMIDEASVIVESLRWVGQIRWNDFIETLNPVGSILSRDPAGQFALLDNQSKSAYYKRIVKLSDGSGVVDVTIAQIALRLARSQESKQAVLSPQNHVGYYLMDEGAEQLERQIHYRSSFGERIHRLIIAHPIRFYFSTAIILAAVVSYPLNLWFGLETLSTSIRLLLVLATIFLSADIALLTINTFLVGSLPIRRLYGMDLTAFGVRPEQATCVVVPSMMRNVASLDMLISRFEVNYLANRGEHIFFVLLLDFADAPAEIMPEDSMLLEAVQKRIQTLNEKYPSPTPIFYALHRKRIWNQSERTFMGWERKRGKLREFNWLIRGTKPTSYVTNGPLPPSHIKYVITLDEDTELLREGAQGLIGCIDHVLNRPVMTADGKIARGFGIIQPRMATRMTTANRTLFSQLFSGAAGIDSYSGPVADLYQDLFGTGIFYGKGIYDIDAVEATMGDSIPENTVLSHDLLEGIYARVGFASHIQIFEGFPSRFSEYSLRYRRWVRGDWQIMSWLFGKRKHFSFIDRWKIVDNLRQSVRPIIAVALIVLTAFFSPKAVVAVSLFILATFSFSFIVGTVYGTILRLRWGTFGRVLANALWSLAREVGRTVIRSVLLLHEAIAVLQEVITTFFRIFISRRNLLRWNTSHEVAQKYKGTIIEYLTLMYPSSIVALVLLSIAWLYFAGEVTLIFSLWIGVWVTAPFVAFLIGTVPAKKKFSSSQEKFLRSIAYRGLRYFTDFVTENNNYLIPDHYQADIPYSGFAPGTTTSITNIGMMLSSFFSGYRLGYLSQREFIERIERSFGVIATLERFKGHFYNWYHIHHRETVTPKYVSSVDSANFTLALMALGQGFEALKQYPIVNPAFQKGLRDMLYAIQEDVLSASMNILPKDLLLLLQDIRMYADRTIFDLRMLVSKTPATYVHVIKEMENHGNRLQELIENARAQSDHPNIVYLYATIQAFRQYIETCRTEADALLSFHILAGSRQAQNLAANGSLASISQKIAALAERAPVLDDLASGYYSQALASLDIEAMLRTATISPENQASVKTWFTNLVERSLQSEAAARVCVEKVNVLKATCERWINEVDFAVLYNKERGLFHMGYNATLGSIDNAYYDFLASETNAVSFVAISKGDARVGQWFHLSRQIISHPQERTVLASWGGSLFEYLTSLLYFSVPSKSLIDEAARRAIKSHINYGREKRVPWGMGESAFAVRHANGDYQYQIFGDPALGLKRGLEERLVVAPYTTALSLEYSRGAAIRNLRRLAREGAWGVYGFFDAIDYTNASRVFLKKFGTPVRIYYAHHVGFAIAAIANALDADEFKKLFHRDPRVQSTDLVFDEPYPIAVPLPHAKEPAPFARRIVVPHEALKPNAEYVPVVSDHPYRYAFLSNGDYTLAINNSGGGWSSYHGVLISRQSHDPLESQCGNFLYLKDATTGALWSAAYLPTFTKGARARAVFFDEKAEFHQFQNNIRSVMTVSVSADDPLEIRTVTLTNIGTTARILDVTSYGEVALAKPEEYLHHPSFQKMFVKSSFHPAQNALYFSRRSADEARETISVFHSVVCHYRDRSPTISITDREDFLGRHGSPATPPGLLSNAARVERPEYTLDPVFSLTKRVTIAAGQSVSLSFLTGAAPSENAAEKIVAKYKKAWTPFHLSRIFRRSARTTDALGAIGVTAYHIGLFQRLLSGIISHEFARYIPEVFFKGVPYMEILWKYGISGDRPLVVVRISSAGDIPFIRVALLFFRYCQHKNVAVDIIILNEYPSGYVKTFEDDIGLLIRQLSSLDGRPEKGSIFHLKTILMEKQDVDLISTLSLLYLDSSRGSLEKQIKEMITRSTTQLSPRFTPTKNGVFKKEELARPRNLLYANSIGGFDEERGEYIIYLGKNARTPAPWVNIIANERFGTLVTESGASTTWSLDSFDNRLTPWQNDVLVDRSGEAFYLRDEEAGNVWSPTPAPTKTGSSYVIRHGTGYTTFESISFEIKTALTVFVPRDAAAKICRFTITNTGEHDRSISLTTYIEPVLGTFREITRGHVSVERDSETGVMFARNRFRHQFYDRCVFVDGGQDTAFTTDRREFLGAHGRIDMPAGLRRTTLSGALDQSDGCIAVLKRLRLRPGETQVYTVTIGEAADVATAIATALRYRSLPVVDAALLDLKAFWQMELGTIVFRTPDQSLNLLGNRWLLYQALSSRMFAKTGFYQPSGAFGFRDQLQDMAALVWTNPKRFRDHIVTAAAHQFSEGDTLNWWHEHNNFGVRSTIADHQAWLPWAASLYVSATGDYELLDEKVAFLESPVKITAITKRWAGTPKETAEKATIYEHCIRAIEKTLVFGSHGLPLIGGGDWNDGLNRVGDAGRGESVWLGWFLIHILSTFIPLAERAGATEKVERYTNIVNDLRAAIEKRAWDGAWYTRAYLDSGAPIGSASNREFKIDSIVQSWSVLSDGGTAEHRARAMESVKTRLMADGDLIRLLDPPLDKMAIDVGYLAAYPPGVRENGAQYNHAALWVIQALAMLHDGDGIEEALRRINPITRSDTKEKAINYRVEPYVIASDIYAAPSYPGRGGWTWYTGSAGLLYRTLVEYIYGIKKTGNVLSIHPALPSSWKNCELTYRFEKTLYQITIRKASADTTSVNSITVSLDGKELSENKITLRGDGGEHCIDVVILSSYS